MTLRGANDELPDRATDELVARWLDEPSSGDWSHEAMVDSLRAADLSFLDALLAHVHGPGRIQNDTRVARVMAAIDAEASGTRPAAIAIASHGSTSRHRRRLAAAVTLAATVLIGVGVLYGLTAPGRVAEAAVQEAFRTAADDRDRQYAVHTRVRTLQGDLTEFDAKLYVRGPSHFALHHPGFIGDLWIGGNGSFYWIKPAIGPAQFVDRLQQPLRWAETNTFGLPQLQMTELLSYLVKDYELIFVGDEPADDGSATHWRHVRGLHRLGTNDRPDVVDLWADPDSGVARRLEMVWNRDPVAAGLEYVSLHLVGEAPQDSSWYDAETHGLSMPSLPRSPLLVPSGE